MSGLRRRALANAFCVRRRSSGSSSAMRIGTMRRSVGMGRPRVGSARRQGDGEGRALARRAVGANAAAVPLDDGAANGQAEARAFVLRLRVEPLEQVEDAT